MKIQQGKKQIKIEISEADLLEKIEEIENCDLSRESKEFFVEALRALVRLDELIGMKETTISLAKDLR